VHDLIGPRHRRERFQLAGEIGLVLSAQIAGSGRSPERVREGLKSARSSRSWLDRHSAGVAIVLKNSASEILLEILFRILACLRPIASIYAQ
jgi:hypothetical protein